MIKFFMLLLATAVVITYSYPPLIHSFAEYWFLLSGGHLKFARLLTRGGVILWLLQIRLSFFCRDQVPEEA